MGSIRLRWGIKCCVRKQTLVLHQAWTRRTDQLSRNAFGSFTFLTKSSFFFGESALTRYPQRKIWRKEKFLRMRGAVPAFCIRKQRSMHCGVVRHSKKFGTPVSAGSEQSFLIFRTCKKLINLVGQRAKGLKLFGVVAWFIWTQKQAEAEWERGAERWAFWNS